jgi:mRNA interferase MazF
MISEGNIALFQFPNTDTSSGKLRPALVIRRTTGRFNDWLICMISSRVHQIEADTDILIKQDSAAFQATGLKVSSVIRSQRLAVVDQSVFRGVLGKVETDVLRSVKQNIAEWVCGSE